MRLCGECGKPVESTAQFCPWCFALPNTAPGAPPPPASSAAPAASAATWAAPVTPSQWPRVLFLVGAAALVVALLVSFLALGGS